MSALRTEDHRGEGARLDLVSLWEIIWRDRWLVWWMTLAFLAAGVCYAFLARPWFRAEVLMIPVAQDEGGGLSSRLGQMGGLAGLAGIAGISLGSGSSAEPVAVLQSREFAREFIESNELLQDLAMAQWTPPVMAWMRGEEAAPDIRDAVDFFTTRVRKVIEDNKKGLVKLSVEWTDPALASEWANQMAKQVNERLRQRAIADATSNISYLRERLAAEDVLSIQQVLSRLIESEMQRLMLAQGRADYAFRVIDRAEVPKEKARPARLKIMMLTSVLGFVVAVLFLLTREAARQSRAARIGPKSL